MYVGFWKRFGANLLDYFVLSAGTIVFFIFWTFMGGILDVVLSALNVEEEIKSNVVGVVGIVLLFSISWLYSAILESSKLKATLGKQAIGLVVVDRNGDGITFLKASIRYWSMIISIIPFFLGFFMAGFTQRKQALHDLISGTFVVRKEYIINNSLRNIEDRPNSI